MLVVLALLAVHPWPRETAREVRDWWRNHQKERWMEIGERMMKNGDHERALRSFHRVTETAPEDPEGWNARAFCLEDAQQFEAAAEAYVQAYRRTEEGEPGFLVSAARCALRAGETERGIELLAEAKEERPVLAHRVLEDEEFAWLRDDDRVQEALSLTETPPPGPDIV
jgi:tetratricopeptide (TPR) repeat protein